MKAETLLIITQLDMQKAGNQILFRTIQGYLREGYRVILLTSNPLSGSNKADYEELFGDLIENLKIYRFNPLLRFLSIPLLKLKNQAFGKLSPTDDMPNLKVDNSVPFVKWHHGILGFISQISFVLGGIIKAFRLTSLYHPNIIYGYEIYGAPLAYIISKIFHIPLITKFQGTIAFPYIEKYGTLSWFMIPNHLIGLKIPAQLIIMENDGTRGKEVLLKLGIPEGKIKFWIDGVKKDMCIIQFNKFSFLKELGLNDEYKVILTVSRLERWKRVDRAIRAMPLVIEKFSKTVLIVVGDGEEKANLIELAKKLKVDRNTIFVGAIPHDEVKKYFNSCDIFLSLYDYSNLCNPVLEALECGKPIITIDDGSTKGILENGQNAILVKKENLSEELPNAIIELLSNDELRLRLSQNAFNTAKKSLLSWEERMKLEISEVEKIL